MVGMTSNAPVTMLGRVCCDETAEGGGQRLKPGQILLEGSRRSSNGARVRLDVDGLPGFCVFPGQVVAVIGTNTLGHTAKVHRLLTAFPPPLPDAVLPAGSPGRRDMFQEGKHTCVWAAQGPYTTHDDMAFEPLAELLAEATQSPAAPDVLVLVRA